MLKTDSVVRCIRTVYRCLLHATSTAREWVLRLAPGGFFLYDTTTPVQAVPANHVDTRRPHPRAEHGGAEDRGSDRY
jgi:hypothetical protein